MANTKRMLLLHVCNDATLGSRSNLNDQKAKVQCYSADSVQNSVQLVQDLTMRR